MSDLVTRLRFAASDDALGIGEAWRLLDEAADEIERLRWWQREVADGMGYVNQAEGQGGYEVAPPVVILAAWRDANYRIEQTERERDEARKEAAWLCGLLKECAALLDSEGIPTPARQVMLARIHAALEGLGSGAERDEAVAQLRLATIDPANTEAALNEALALLRECRALMEEGFSLYWQGEAKALFARLDAALEGR